MGQMFLISRIAVRELIHERVLYILLCFSVMALGLSSVLGQMTYAEQSKLTLDFMLAAIQLSMVVFAVFMGISLLKKELAWGSVSMLLSKPVSRWSFLLGKLLGQSVVQLFIIMGMLILTYLRAGLVSPLALAQAGILIFFEVTILTAITYCAVVNSGAIMAALIAAAFFIVGHLKAPVHSILTERGEPVSWTILKSIVPNLEIFNMKMLVSYGTPISWAEFGWASVYFAVCLSLFLAIAVGTFSQKDIQT